MRNLLRVLLAAALLAGVVACKDRNTTPQSGAATNDMSIAGNTNSGTSSGTTGTDTATMPETGSSGAGTSGASPSTGTDSSAAQGGTSGQSGTAEDSPAMTADLQKCDALQGEQRVQCVDAVNKKNGRM